MKMLRLALGFAAIVLLGAGYMASQFAAFSGTTAEYAKKVDQPSIQGLALGFLVLTVILSFIPDREGKES